MRLVAKVGAVGRALCASGLPDRWFANLLTAIAECCAARRAPPCSAAAPVRRRSSRCSPLHSTLALLRPTPLLQVKIEHTDLGGSFVKPQSAKDVEVALEHCERGGGVVLSVGLKPRPVSTSSHSTTRCKLSAWLGNRQNYSGMQSMAVSPSTYAIFFC